MGETEQEKCKAQRTRLVHVTHDNWASPCYDEAGRNTCWVYLMAVDRAAQGEQQSACHSTVQQPSRFPDTRGGELNGEVCAQATQNALAQTGWQGETLTEANWRDQVYTRLRLLDWHDLQANVRPFVKASFDHLSVIQHPYGILQILLAWHCIDLCRVQIGMA